MKLHILLVYTLALFFCFNQLSAQNNSSVPDINSMQKKASNELYQTIVHLDSLYFDAYNRCEMRILDSLTAEDIEFYHDRSGLSTSKKEILESVQKYICGKVRRILKPGSIEVSEIPNYGAVQMGAHSFRNLAENSQSEPSRFITLWRKDQGRWQMSRVISLH